MSPALRAYHGSIRPGSHGQVPCDILSPQASGHLRVHTVEHFQPPLRATWWLYTANDMRPVGTSGATNMDGLHIHFAHLDNDMNGLIHAVRRDESGKVSLQHGLTGYHDLERGSALPLRLWRRYLFTLDWLPDRVSLHVSNDNHLGGIEEATVGSVLPSWAPRSGQLGWRLDNLTVKLGGLTVREL